MLRECLRGDFQDDPGQGADSEPGGAGVGPLGVGEVKGARLCSQGMWTPCGPWSPTGAVEEGDRNSLRAYFQNLLPGGVDLIKSSRIRGGKLEQKARSWPLKCKMERW